MKKITLGNVVKEYEEGTTYGQIVEENFPDVAQHIILVKINGKLEELAKKVKRDCILEPIYYWDNPGYNSYRRSTSFLMLKAIYDLYNREEIGKVRIEFSAGAGYFCTLSGSIKVDEAFTIKVESRMKECVAQAIPIQKDVVNTEEAIARFVEYGMTDKAALFRYRRASKVNIYSIGGFQDYYYGYMVPSTGYIDLFDVQAYKEGILLILPTQEKPNEILPFVPREN